MLAHNGEINTLRGNLNALAAREPSLSSPVFGDELKKILPLIPPGGSDSASLDNMFELLVAAGRDVDAVDDDSARRRRQKAHEMLERNRFARPRRTGYDK